MAKQIQLTIDDVKYRKWSYESADFINQLIIRKPELRLGYQGIAMIKEHNWFEDFNWNELSKRKLVAPFIPEGKENVNWKYVQRSENETKERYEMCLNNKEKDDGLFLDYTFYKGDSFDMEEGGSGLIKDEQMLFENNYKKKNRSSMYFAKQVKENDKRNKGALLLGNRSWNMNNNNNSHNNCNKNGDNNNQLNGEYGNKNNKCIKVYSSRRDKSNNNNYNKDVGNSSPFKQYIDNFKYKAIDINTFRTNNNNNDNSDSCNNNNIKLVNSSNKSVNVHNSRNTNNNNNRQLVINTKGYYRSFSNFDLNDMLMNNAQPSLSPNHLSNKCSNISLSPPQNAIITTNQKHLPPKHSSIGKRNYLEINTNTSTMFNMNSNNITTTPNTHSINKSSRNKSIPDKILGCYTTSNTNNNNNNNNYYLYSTCNNNNNNYFSLNNNNTLSERAYYTTTINNNNTYYDLESTNCNSNSNSNSSSNHKMQNQTLTIKPLNLSHNFIPIDKNSIKHKGEMTQRVKGIQVKKGNTVFTKQNKLNSNSNINCLSSKIKNNSPSKSIGKSKQCGSSFNVSGKYATIQTHLRITGVTYQSKTKRGSVKNVNHNLVYDSNSNKNYNY